MKNIKILRNSNVNIRIGGIYIMINVNKTLTYTHVFRVCAKRMPYEPSQDEKFVYKQNVF